MIDVTVKGTEPVTVAFISVHGSFNLIPEKFGELYAWIGMHGYTPTGPPQAVYLTAPDQVEPDHAVFELWSAVGGAVERDGLEAGGLGVKQIPAMTVAMTMHVGPYDTIASTYMALGEWAAANGYEMAGPPQEVYLSDPNETPPAETLTEIRFPVRAK